MARNLDQLRGMDHDKLAELALEQATHLANYQAKLHALSLGLHLRRLEVATLRDDLGLPVDDECQRAVVREAQFQETHARADGNAA